MSFTVRGIEEFVDSQVKLLDDLNAEVIKNAKDYHRNNCDNKDSECEGCPACGSCEMEFMNTFFAILHHKMMGASSKSLINPADLN
jgi:hypothetical protein